MKIIYKDRKVEDICTNMKKAQKKLGDRISIKLFQAIEYINNSISMKDIIAYQPFHFHDLKGNRNDEFAIDIGGRSSGYRLILEPLDGQLKRFEPCNIDEIVETVEIVLILEVSKHYE